ncbi:putative repeat protein (TIGR03943 family) [Roseimicrobium gellanilyticum]|uniref:Putative repeat protein (TIGR03943 family) n=1 Tax=Roseimicrobium gellanilyticum TaxID=748857 RepID=A0A366HGH7_9BACT|nr:hypothetical protein [Roseimicrobium gellanilyticum]RBP41311.1 putative repeat protein (TIGR03943 family) [Roseimicrobium gellanilyticum]
MTSKRIGIHLISVSLLLLWGGIMLYFYTSGRITHYLPPDGIFRPMVLWSSIGLIVLALFNLATMKAKEAACCADDGHDHDHDHCGHDHHHDHAHKHDHGHAHAHGHGHSHEHKDGCCGGHGHSHDHGHKHEDAHAHSHAHEHEHEHDHGHGHSHSHEHKDGCCGGHSHSHDHGHKPDNGHVHGPGCGHDHGHGHHHHDHAHGCCGGGGVGVDHVHKDEHDDHDHEHSHAGHSHGILEESGMVGRVVAICLLAVPVSYAAMHTPDKFSANAVVNKGVYAQNYGQGARAEQYSLKRERPGTGNTNAVTTAPAPDKPVAATGTPPSSTPGGQDVMPKVNVAEVEKQAAKGAETKSYGSFTLADLEAQVPKSKDGNFMLEVTELYYTAGDKEVQSVLTGQPVETIAQVLPEKVNNEKGTRLRLFRMLVQCCAADARPYSIPVEFGKEAPHFKEMTWVKVVGKMSFTQEGGQTVPVLEATKIEETAAPENQMIY